MNRLGLVAISLAFLGASGCASYPLWDGVETVPAYAKKAGITQTEITLPLNDEKGMRLVLVPAGTFLMGSSAEELEALRRELLAAGVTPDAAATNFRDEAPQHEVTISRPFFIGALVVTRAQWAAVMETDPETDYQWSDPDLPADFISWRQANQFCQKLSQKSGRIVRLPTEAEWEYAFRAGARTRFCYGDDPGYTHLADYAWFQKWKKDSQVPTPPMQKAGQKKPNRWGLYDVHGNSWQLCSDWYGKDYYRSSPKVDPNGPLFGTVHVHRGGASYNPGWSMRSADRGWNKWSSDDKVSHSGFRVVVELSRSNPPSN